MTHGYKITICDNRTSYTTPTREWIRSVFGITNEEILNFIRTKKPLKIVSYEQEPNSPNGVAAFEGVCVITRIKKPTKRRRNIARRVRKSLKGVQISDLDFDALVDMVIV